ncbi:MAG: anthranilate phosphoribosyltransferase [Chloroflexus sp.]|jgi:anthranilate phosphoribosyltransferase|nr:anthranilate phosphoribosyltransferase [Chloroflexus sp.]MBO9317744.1 anthranilate phosphoribosyltransferase [Chloroflexus sp.]MBO9338147.1 anthranilate phosphoribosyltransferase [Chloroflexus sp.]MBO9372626.1 anthranilate phosphoribosyltransferase [Chloroflexus sp.]
MNIREAIAAVVARRDLTQAEAASVMEEIMSGAATPAQIGAFLTALHMKGETDAEIAGMAAVMREKATHVYFDGPVIDTCGTGGDGAHTFNISTTAAFVAAGAGLTVAKHGNRAMSSVCGSADVLEGLGVQIELDAEGVARCLREAGIGFMFAPKFHPAMRFAGPVRREIGIRTVFNILGPLTNPARARYQVLGVASAALAEKLAYALSRLETIHALVVHGDGGVDELTLSGPNLIFEVRAGQPPRQIIVTPEDVGLARAPQDALRGGDVAYNVAIIRAILSGEDQGPRRDVVLLNAAAAMVAGDLAPDLKTGVAMARHSIDSGRALERLNRMIAVSRGNVA